MRGLNLLAVVPLIVLAVGCSSKEAEASRHPADPAVESLATSRQVMLGLTIPAADVVWQVGGNVPADDLAWERVAANAEMLAESGLLLLGGPRNIDQPEWRQYANELVTYARQAAAAAGKHDLDAVLEAGDALYGACETCHNKYLPAKVAELAAEAGAPAP